MGELPIWLRLKLGEWSMDYLVLGWASGPGPHLNKKCTWLSGSTLSHEILRRIYFDVKPLN